MPRQYKAKQGDTLANIAAIHDGSTQNLANIKKANPQVQDPNNVTGGTIVTIPDIPGVTDRGEPPAAPLVGGDEDLVTIKIAGALVPQWEDISVTRSIDAFGTYRASRPWDITSDDDRDRYRPYQYRTVAVNIGSDKVITGILLSVTPSAAPGKNSIGVAGYSLPGILSDCTPSPSSYPLRWTNAALDIIAERLCEGYSIAVEVAADIGPAFQRAAMKPTEKILPYLIKLGKQRGVLISDTPDGALLLQTAPAGGSSASLNGGKYPAAGPTQVTYDGQKRFSTVTALCDGWWADFLGQSSKSIFEDSSMPVARHLVTQMPDTQAGMLADAAQSYHGRLLAESISYRVPVVSWRNQDGELWQPGTIVTYKDPGAMIYSETDLLIRSVQYERRANVLSAVLTLVLPEAYNGGIRDSYPWDG